MAAMTKITLGIPSQEGQGNQQYLLNDNVVEVREAVYGAAEGRPQFMEQCTFTKDDGFRIVINTSLVLVIEELEAAVPPQWESK